VPGRYHLRITTKPPDGGKWVRYTRPLTLERDQRNLNIDIVTERLAGEVTAPDGRPVAEAMLLLGPAEMDSTRRQAFWNRTNSGPATRQWLRACFVRPTDVSGETTVYGLRPGQYNIGGEGSEATARVTVEPLVAT